MNWPNILTVSRFFLTVAFIYYVRKIGEFYCLLAIVCFVLAVLSDYLDGYFARKYNLFTDFGKIMDPIADKFLILSAFFIFMQWHFIAPWMFYAIACREVLVTVSRLFLMKKGKVIAAEAAGKAKTVLQMAAILGILGISFWLNSHKNPSPSSWVFGQGTMAHVFIGGIQPVMTFVVFLTLYSGIKYFWQNRAEPF